MSTISAPPDGIDTIFTIGALLKRLLLTTPAEQFGTSGALTSLGKVLEIANASDALELLVTGGDHNASADTLGSFEAILRRCRRTSR